MSSRTPGVITYHDLHGEECEVRAIHIARIFGHEEKPLHLKKAGFNIVGSDRDYHTRTDYDRFRKEWITELEMRDA